MVVRRPTTSARDLPDAEETFSSLVSCLRSAGKNQCLALFTERDGELVLYEAVGFPRDLVARVRPGLRFAKGESRGIVGLVAQSMSSLYVPDTWNDPRWIGRTSAIRSVYFVPESLGERAFVLCLLDRKIDGITMAHRALANALVCYVAKEHKRAETCKRVLKSGLDIPQWMGRDGAAPVAAERPATGGWNTANSHDVIDCLSPREQQAVALLMRGHRIKTIAVKMSISPYTVRNHLRKVFQKLRVHSQVELLSRLRAANAK